MSDLYLFRNALRDLLRPRKIAAALVLIALPLVIALLIRFNVPAKDYKPNEIYNALAGLLVFDFILVIMAVVFGTGVIAQEIEQKTIVYLLTRPLPRWRIALMKFAAAFVVITLTVWAAASSLALAVYGPSGLSGTRLGRDLLVLPMGALAYGALFLLLATLFNRPLMYGLLFAFGWESWVPNLPGNFPKMSLVGYLRALAPHPQNEDAVDVAQVVNPLAPATISHSMAWSVLIGVTLVALFLALFIFSTNEYVPREDAE